MSDIVIYTDGACSGNPGAGGWGVVIIKNAGIEKFNGYENQAIIIRKWEVVVDAGCRVLAGLELVVWLEVAVRLCPYSYIFLLYLSHLYREDQISYIVYPFPNIEIDL